MKHIKTFQIFESQDDAGVYSTEQMDAFVREIAKVADWSGASVNVPSSDRNASTPTKSAEELLSKWEVSLKNYSKDKDVKWYVWTASVGGSVNKPKKIAEQRYDIDSILSIVSKYPDALRRMSIGFTSEEQRKHDQGMSDWYKSGSNYKGD